MLPAIGQQRWAGGQERGKHAKLNKIADKTNAQNGTRKDEFDA